MKEPLIVPVVSKSNVLLVFEQLEKLIADGFWNPEERILSEAELCGKFNVGRSTIREALNMLKAKNLIYTIPGLGTFVSRPEKVDPVMLNAYIPDPKSEGDLLNIMELRLSIEPLNAVFAARRATPEQLEDMRRHHKALASSAGAKMFAESDNLFHLKVAEATGNPLVIEVMNMVSVFLEEQQIATSQQESRRNRAARYHEQIFDAIANGDELKAEDAMREHMDDTYIYIKSIVNLSERQSGRWRKKGEKQHTAKPAK